MSCSAPLSLRRLSPSISALLLMLSLCACERPVPITQISFEKDQNFTGSIHVSTPDSQKLGPGQVILIERTSRLQEITIPETLSSRVNIVLNYESSGNLPADLPVRVAAIQTSLKIKAAKDVLQPAEIELVDGRVYLNGGEAEPVVCDSLFQASVSDRKLRISFLGFRALTSCQGTENSSLAHYDPEKIGLSSARNVSDGRNKYSDQDDQNMGAEAAREFLQQYRGQILADSHPATVWSREMMERIAASSDRPDIRPTVYVINANVLNAFALPGGYVFVFRGLIDAARSESEVIGVLGHEWAHVTARHGTKNVTRALDTMKKMLIGAVVGIGIGVAGDVNDNVWMSLVGKVILELSTTGGQVYLLSKSREAETEADLLGSQYAWNIGYEPWGIADMFGIFIQNTPGGNRMDDVYSSHPALPKRIDRVLNWSAFYYPRRSTYERDSARFRDVKLALSSTPRLAAQESQAIGNAFAGRVQGISNSILEAQANRDKQVIIAAAAASDILKDILRDKKEEKRK